MNPVPPPLFSIIIPLYNSSGTLTATLESIAAQQFENFEVLFIDGSSTDDTLEILDKFYATHQNIRCITISEPDKGIYDAYNKGLRIATGKWMYFMGSDDQFCSSTVLQDISNVIINSNADLVYGNVVGMISGKRYAPAARYKVFTEGLHHQGVFYKKEIFAYTGNYDLRFRIAADYHLTLKAFLNPAFHTLYMNIDVARFGEGGLSSVAYDYRFYSYYYRFLCQHYAVHELGDDSLIFENSINACFQLSRLKTAPLYGWNNLLYYLFRTKKYSIGQKAVALKRMVYWMFAPVNHAEI